MKQLDHFSISQLKNYLLCPLSYYFQYVEELDWEYQPADMLFGKVCHQTIARFHTKQFSLDKIQADFQRRWKQTITQTDNLRFSSLDESQLATRGKRLMEIYYQQFNQLNPQEVEMFFEIPLINLDTGKFAQQIVQGRIDLIADNTVWEVKTSSRSANQDNADSSLQLTFYCWAYQYLYSKPPENLKLIVLVKNKSPKIQVFQTQRQMSDFSQLYNLMTGTIKAIQKDIFYPNPLYKYGCKRCQFQKACSDYK